MLDGERPYVRSELPQDFWHAPSATECPRVWRGRTAIESLSAFQKEKKDPYKGPFKLYLEIIIISYLQTLTF